MCGIAGVMRIDGQAPEPALLDRLADALGHRGPDGRGHFIADATGLVQTRLAIIDLKTGDQPFIDDGSGIGLVANGEIYNYLELRSGADLARVPHRSQSDCEPPLHLYRLHGLDFTRTLRGMYAIALYDPAHRRLVLARDPFGIKPLYYIETDWGLAFASEPQALVAAGLVGAAVLDEGVRDELLALQFTTGRGTIFQGIERVLPGEVLVVEAGRIRERLLQPALPAGPPRQAAVEQAVDKLDTILEEAVVQHCRSDVPYGLFLSGGVDSSLVLSYMAANGQRVRTFTAGFDSRQVADERPEARILAEAVKADHTDVLFDEDDFWTLLPEIAAALDDPVADYAALPSYKLAKVAAAELKVVLTGEGGDELFAGYGRYRRVVRPWWLGGREPKRKNKIARTGVLRPDSRPGSTGERWRRGIDQARRAEALPGRSRLQVAQAVDCATWLPGDLLTKLDRCLMAHALEGRTPFLDPVVADFALTLPDNLKVRGRHGKHLCRLLLQRRLAAAQPFARKKGFNVPVRDWIARRGRDLGPLVAQQPAVRALCEPAKVVSLFASPGREDGPAAWNLLFYALWHRRHIDGTRPTGDVFEMLKAA